ncbi:ankyrin repeat domain-containing protein SOWAHA [Protobothrops mucrosquamatus]|uniref:ankyrin repeat domain-containing protein SOWAHA n=1 Tax=Protobothrops mucrosquamatus TaxID=103944 RepID=UPI0007758A0E|nr:ankyrin repeat domain-containing protein SOWAHA [Protobothrops mucrosquamatus]
MAEFLNKAAVLGFLREQGGQVRNSLLLAHFKPLLDAPEATPEVRAALRQRFVHLVNSVAAVRVSEGIKLVVLRNRHQLARDDSDAEPRSIAFGDLSDEETEGADSGAPACPAGFVAPLNSPEKEDPDAHRTIPVFQLKNLFQRGGSEILKVPSGKDQLAPKGASPKPCMLPVRSVPLSSTNAKRSEELSPEQDRIPVEDGLQVDLPAILLSPSPRAKRRQLNEMGPKSLSLGRGSKPLKVGEEADSTTNVPLEPVEHQWVVKATAGQWSQQLHGLLLIDLNLASKRDFMSGFTVLHWAAKSGNSKTLSKVLEMAEKGGIHVDVNAKSYGGYTPLHIAALHGQEEVIAQLVKVYNAKVNLRDYSGKKPFQYLKEGSSFAVRYLLNDPGLHTERKNPSIKKNIKVAASILSSTSTVLGLLSDDVAFYELTKGLKKPAPINKFLNIATAPRRKLNSRRAFSTSTSSLSQALEEEKSETASKHRPLSELFFGHLSH